MKSIVTGGAGFIGSHLVEHLVKNKHKVLVIDNFKIGRRQNLKSIRNKVKIINCDIRNFEKISKYFKGADNVFHLAALADIVPSIENPNEYYSTNVTGTFNVLKASIQNNVKRFIYSASSSCYGIPKKYPTKENSDISPEYPYALTKRLGEELVLHFAKVYNLNATSLRFFNVYGLRARTTGSYGAVFGVFLAQLIANKPFTIVGDGTQTRDFTYVTDLAEALKSAMETQGKNQIYNVGSGETTSINKIAELLGGKDYEKLYIPKRPGEPDCTFADITKIQRDLNWSPKISIEEGVIEILKHLDYWKEAPVWTPETISHETKDWFKYLGEK